MNSFQPDCGKWSKPLWVISSLLLACVLTAMLYVFAGKRLANKPNANTNVAARKKVSVCGPIAQPTRKPQR